MQPGSSMKAFKSASLANASVIKVGGSFDQDGGQTGQPGIVSYPGNRSQPGAVGPAKLIFSRRRNRRHLGHVARSDHRRADLSAVRRSAGDHPSAVGADVTVYEEQADDDQLYSRWLWDDAKYSIIV